MVGHDDTYQRSLSAYDVSPRAHDSRGTSQNIYKARAAEFADRPGSKVAEVPTAQVLGLCIRREFAINNRDAVVKLIHERLGEMQTTSSSVIHINEVTF